MPPSRRPYTFPWTPVTVSRESTALRRAYDLSRADWAVGEREPQTLESVSDGRDNAACCTFPERSRHRHQGEPILLKRPPYNTPKYIAVTRCDERHETPWTSKPSRITCAVSVQASPQFRRRFSILSRGPIYIRGNFRGPDPGPTRRAVQYHTWTSFSAVDSGLADSPPPPSMPPPAASPPPDDAISFDSSSPSRSANLNRTGDDSRSPVHAAAPPMALVPAPLPPPPRSRPPPACE